MADGRKCGALILALLLLCGCDRARAPEEELQAAGKPVEGLPAAPQTPETPRQPLLAEGLCALLPDASGHCVLYDCWGNGLAVLPVDETAAGVYAADGILAGYRLSDGSPVLPEAAEDALWQRDAEGFTVLDTAGGMLYRLDLAGTLQFSVEVPPETAWVSLLPLGRGYVCSLWRGSGTAEDPWGMTAPCVVLDRAGAVEADLSSWVSAPVTGILGDACLLLAREDGKRVDVFDRTGVCLGEDVLPVTDQSQPAPLGGVLCRQVWRDGWLYSADLQPLQPCAAPETLVVYGEQISGTEVDIDGVAGNGELLVFADGAAFWGIAEDALAIQWQGINYHFPAGKRQFQRLQLCNQEMAVVWAWDADGSGSLRLLYFATGMVLEYDCPAGAQISAMLGQGYALLAQADAATGAVLRVVDADGRLRCTDTRPLLPCAAGPYLLRREGIRCIIVGLDGTPISIGQDG